MPRYLPLILIALTFFNSGAAAQDTPPNTGVSDLFKTPEIKVPAAAAPAQTDGGDAATAVDVDAFRGEGSLGVIISSGNTENEAINGGIKAVYEQNRWAHGFQITAKRVTEQQIVTAERYLFTEKSDYTFSEHTYTFISLRYDDDRFDGFDYQSSATTGIGWHIIEEEQHHFDLEIGAGQRRNKISATGEVITETAQRFSEHYDNQLTETTKLTQDLVIESGDSNTTSEFNIAIKVAVNNALALQVAHNIKHNSNPPTDRKATDRTTSVALVFGF